MTVLLTTVKPWYLDTIGTRYIFIRGKEKEEPTCPQVEDIQFSEPAGEKEPTLKTENS